MEEKSIINNEFDYSTIIPKEENILYLVKYCDSLYQQMQKRMEEEEEKNKPFKFEYKEYMYKKNYSNRFEVYIFEKTYNNISCKDIVSFETAMNCGQLKNVNSLEITLNLSFERGKNNALEEHENLFVIKFQPYHIIFARKSNFVDSEMNEIESSIRGILDKFPKTNSIFCSK